MIKLMLTGAALSLSMGAYYASAEDSYSTAACSDSKGNAVMFTMDFKASDLNYVIADAAGHTAMLKAHRVFFDGAKAAWTSGGAKGTTELVLYVGEKKLGYIINLNGKTST
jgi:hypothetical protein